MEAPTLKNILILGMFSDGKVRKLICTEIQQLAVLNVMRAIDPDDNVKVIDEVLEGISWESEIDLNSKIETKN